MKSLVVFVAAMAALVIDLIVMEMVSMSPMRLASSPLARAYPFHDHYSARVCDFATTSMDYLTVIRGQIIDTTLSEKAVFMTINGLPLTLPFQYPHVRTTALRLAVSVFIPASLITATFVGCSDVGRGDESSSNRLVPAVEAVQARHGTLPLTERLSGVVKARNQVEIYPEISAMILQVLVENGDAVDAKQPLVLLRDKEFRERLNQANAALQIASAQARQAEAQLNEIQAELQRSETLGEKKLISETDLQAIRTRAISADADLELARARVEQAQATVLEREETLAQTIVRAPVDGTIGNRNAEVGMLVSPGTRLFTLGQLDSVRIEVVLTDLMLNYIEVGQRAEAYAGQGVDGRLTATVSRISPFLHPITHSTDGEIDMANPGVQLKPGMFVPVDIHYGDSEQATLVPLSAVYENPNTGGTGVYVSKENVPWEGGATSSDAHVLVGPVAFEFVPVEVVAKGRMEAGVRGIEPGTWVITLGQDLLRGGSGNARVRPVAWERVAALQQLQRQDLLQELLQRQQQMSQDTLAFERRQMVR